MFQLIGRGGDVFDREGTSARNDLNGGRNNGRGGGGTIWRGLEAREDGGKDGHGVDCVGGEAVGEIGEGGKWWWLGWLERCVCHFWRISC